MVTSYMLTTITKPIQKEQLFEHESNFGQRRQYHPTNIIRLPPPRHVSEESLNEWSLTLLFHARAMRDALPLDTLYLPHPHLSHHLTLFLYHLFQ